MLIRKIRVIRVLFDYKYMSIKDKGLEKEVSFATSRAGGPGGQNVNKVESRVELLFTIDDSEILSDAQKKRIHLKLFSRISKEGILKIADSSSRSQLQNKNVALKRFYELLEESFKRKKKRIPTKPGKAAKRKRLDKKKMQSEKKERRKKP